MFCFKQAVFQDGETVGEPKFKISWSKVHKSFRERPVAVKKDYGYMMAKTFIFNLFCTKFTLFDNACT